MNSDPHANGYIHISSASPAETARDVQGNPGAQPDDERFDTAAALLRLLVGGALVGARELRLRLERWQQATPDAASIQAVAPRTNSPSDALRHTLMGMMFETESRMRRRFSNIGRRLARASQEANRFYATAMSDMRYTPLDPLRARLEETVYRATMTLDRWADRGRMEEQQSRDMTQEAVVSVIDELLDYMARNPEVRELIEQQGMSMAETAVDEVRERSATADMWIERIARGLLHRPASENPEQPAAISSPETTTTIPTTVEADMPRARQSRR
ncbi:MAG TPA: hypothetical protein VFW17_21900 [Ktedonobacterales bacterium]|nr:hypothetical protein [Ktedonobacterales bacterium]